MKPLKVLIVDDEEAIREILGFFVDEIAGPESKIVHAESGQAAIAELKKEKFDLCICDHNMPNGMGPSVLKFITEEKMSVKFVLCSTVTPSDDPVNYPAELVFGNIQKPEIFKGVEHVFSMLKIAENDEWKSVDYIPVTIEFLALILFAPADVYIRLSEKKVVKCLNKNDIFDQTEKEKYKAKAINTLFLKTEGDKSLILTNIRRRIKDFLTGSEMRVTDRLALTHHQMCEMIKLEGMTPEHQEMVRETIFQTAKIINLNSKLSDFWDRLDMLGDYPSQVYTLQVVIASATFKNLSWFSESTFIKLSLAAFVQDITLSNLELIKIIDYVQFQKEKEKFSEEERQMYLHHPQAACELIAGFRDIPSDVDRLVLEQHEMPNGNGFPRMLNANQTGPLSCLFILSGLLAKIMIDNKGPIHKAEFIQKFSSEGYNKGNYKEIFEAMAEILPQ